MANELQHRREMLLALARLYRDLSTALAGYFEAHATTPSYLASALGLTHVELVRIAERTSLVTTPRVLQPLAELLDCSAAVAEIMALAKALGRSSYAAVADEEAIVCAFTLIDAHSASGAHAEAFSAAFVDDASAVAGALQLNASSVVALDAVARARIEAVMAADDFVSKIATCVDVRAQALRRSGDELEQILAPVAEEYSREALAEALGFNRGTLSSALRGEVGSETMERILAAARTFVNPPPATKDPPPAAPPQEEAETATLALQAFAGDAEGVLRFVQRVSNARAIRGDPGPVFVPLYSRILDAAIAAMNIDSQLDPEIRRAFASEISPRLEELWLAMQRASARHTNRVRALMDRQREALRTVDLATAQENDE